MCANVHIDAFGGIELNKLQTGTALDAQLRLCRSNPGLDHAQGEGRGRPWPSILHKRRSVVQDDRVLVTAANQCADYAIDVHDAIVKERLHEALVFIQGACDVAKMNFHDLPSPRVLS